MKTCENCGCKVYSNGCVNCNEELYILDQYYEQDMKLPKEDTDFMKKVHEQQRSLANKTHIRRYRFSLELIQKLDKQ